MGVGAGLYMYNVIVNKVLYGTCQNLFRDPQADVLTIPLKYGI